METAPAGLLDDAIEHDLNDFRVTHWFTVGHTLHLTWLEIEEGNAFGNAQMNRAKSGNNEGYYTTTYCGVNIKLIPHLVIFHACFLIHASREGHQARLKKYRYKYISQTPHRMRSRLMGSFPVPFTSADRKK